MTGSKVPPWVLAEAAEPDRFVDMTPEERIELCLQLCDVTDSIVNARPDVDALRAPTALSPESEQLWRRLVKAGLDARRHARG